MLPAPKSNSTTDTLDSDIMDPFITEIPFNDADGAFGRDILQTTSWQYDPAAYQGSFASNGKNSVDYSDMDDEKKQERLERNREIARKCRKRKRERANALADEVNKLRETNKNLEIQLKICQSKLGQATSGRGNRGVEEENRRAEEVKRMMKMLETRASNDDLVSRLDSYTSIYSDFGEERQKVLQAHFAQLVKLLYPTQVSKMLLWVLEQDDQFYSTTVESDASSVSNSIWHTLCEELNLEPKQKELLLEQRNKLGKQNESFTRVLAKVKNLEKEIERGMKERKKQFEEITSVISPAQQVKFLNWVETNQPCIHLLDNLWAQRAKEPGDNGINESTVKQMKTEQY